ncbi:DUF4274 domain-containing protein [Parasphingorhabdus halotolerans]|uniref:DUF4274 domain-containing protein n=1 Tax=Parasphingorhabdus halotolerans TaxID=2725558 RepID=A0A6H2DLX0_9SPHN|nr:DUF4274 domain-containing protein [Parasphingorhabdus halotolerans]QJB69127.1 DUF4274 domain-containing protein [Parasphingorhabdus halotolerans]
MDSEEKRIDRQIDWLKNASPEDWHRVAISFDYYTGGPIDPLFWIVRQDECDKATALNIFWKTRPQSFLRLLAEEQPIDNENQNWKMAQFISQRLNEHGFTRSNIAFEATSYIESDYEQLVSYEEQLAQSPLKSHEDMKLSISGQKIDLNGEFAKRYPQEFHNAEIREEHLTALQIDYLKEGSPDDWHLIAADWNWDNRLDVLYWIVTQPECDRATALLVFWKGEPACCDYETEEAKMGDDIYAVAPMLRYISERFNTTGYTRSEIEFNYLVAKGAYTDSRFAPKDEDNEIGDVKEIVERQKDLTDPKVKLHPDMKLSNIVGRKVSVYGSQNDFYNKFPLYFDIDGSEMGSGAVVTESDFQRPINEARKDDGAVSVDDASARIRAIRDGTEQKDVNAGLPGFQSEAISLIFNTVFIGIVLVAFTIGALSRYGQVIGWLIGGGLLLYLSYSALSCIQTMKSILNSHGFGFPKLRVAISMVTSLSVGAVLGYLFLNDVGAFRENYGMVAVLVFGFLVVLPTLWFAAKLLFRILFNLK